MRFLVQLARFPGAGEELGPAEDEMRPWLEMVGFEPTASLSVELPRSILDHNGARSGRTVTRDIDLLDPPDELGFYAVSAVAIADPWSE